MRQTVAWFVYETFLALLSDCECGLRCVHMFDQFGYLPAGLHDWTLTEIEDRLVVDFPKSATRPRIMSGYKQLRTDMSRLGVVGTQWIDGSFSTIKADPGDVDLLTIADKAVLDSLPVHCHAAVKALVSGKVTQHSHHCDSYAIVQVPKSHPDYDTFRKIYKYWLGEFGFDREDRPKGIVRTPL